MRKSILKSVHESVKDLHEIGLVDNITMRHFDTLCSYLPPVKKISPKNIQKIRLREKLSQPVFAYILNVSPSTVKHWELGDKCPSGAALKLLSVIAQKGIEAIV